MPDLVVTPQTQSLTVTQTVQALTLDAVPPLTINQNLPLQYSFAVCVSNVSIAVANQFYSAIGISLTAGTWLLVAQINCNGPAATYSARISDVVGTTVYGSAESSTRATSAVSIGLNGIVTVTATTTVYLMATSNASGCTIRSTTPTQSLPGCTRIDALRVSL